MRAINKPLVSQLEICDSLKDLNYKDRVIEKSADYTTYLANPDDLYVDEENFKSSDKDYYPHMQKMYSERFSNKNYKDSYRLYKKIRESQDICPYCGLETRKITHLEHYLPKSKFPSLSITTDNLIPVCMDCNITKREYDKKSKANSFIHPYFDDKIGSSFDFLKCEVIEKENIGFSFYIDKLPNWDDDLFDRVRSHFEKLKIFELYTTDFTTDFDTMFNELIYYYNENPNVNEIYKIIERRVKAVLATGRKPWSYVGFSSILNCKWFFDMYLPLKLIT